MQAYVGIDVHRRRSQIAVIDDSGRTAVNRNVPNGRETLLGVIGDLPVGTPVAFEAAYGWGLTALPGIGPLNPWLRWIMNQAAQTAKRTPPYAACFEQIAHR